MKTNFFAIVAFFAVISCDNSPIIPSYYLILPELPGHWLGILEEPHWRLEWVGEAGLWLEWELGPGQTPPPVSLMPEWSSPVLAWPYWPSIGLFPGMMRPAGAMFPWDVSGQAALTLSWRGGLDAVFWKELANAERPSTPESATAARRIPWYFDWPRFRELLSGEDIPEAVRHDPWLADWKDIAQRTVNSGFDRRRIVSRRFSELEIPGLDGLWAGSSPFAPPIEAQSDSPLSISVNDTTDVWVSSGGVLKASTAGWVRHRRTAD